MTKKLTWNLVAGSCLSILLIGLIVSRVKHNKTPVADSQKQEDVTDVSIRGTNLPDEPLDERDVIVAKKSVKHLVLSASNTVFLVGPIGAESMTVIDQMNEKAKSAKEIYLVINSPGGSVMDGALIVSAVQSSKVPVHTVCMQFCASMAAIIHQYGKQRYMVDRSHLMFHEAAGGLEGQFNQVRTRFNAYSRFTDKMDYEIAQRAGQSYETFRSKLADEIWIDAEDAINQHFTDRIVSVEFETSGESSPQVLNFFKKVRSQDMSKKIKVIGE